MPPTTRDPDGTYSVSEDDVKAMEEFQERRTAMPTTTSTPEQPTRVLDDLWTSFPNVHLRVLTAEHGAIEIQICDCGMSGQCHPQGWARIERHNRNRLAAVISLEDQ